MLSVLYGIVGIFAGYMMLVWMDKLVERKCSRKNIEAQNKLFSKTYLKIGLYIINAIAWALAGLQAGNPIDALLLSVLFSLAVMIAFIDLRIHIIPNELVLSTLIIGVLFQLIYFGDRSLLIAAACMVGIMIVFLLVAAIVGFDKVGAGDVKLAGVMGLVLGYPHILTAVLAMCAAMLIYFYIGFKMYRLTLKSMFPYGPFMMIGLIVALVSIVVNISI